MSVTQNRETLKAMGFSHRQAFQKTARPRWWHDDVIDFMLANPTVSNNEIARHFNRTPAWFGLLLGSDAFKQRLSERRKEQTDRVGFAIESKLMANLNATMEVMTEVIAKKRDAIPFSQLLDFQDKTLSRLGYGTEKGASLTINNQINGVGPQTVIAPVTAEALASARDAIRRQEAAQVLEHIPVGEVLSAVPPLPLLDGTEARKEPHSEKGEEDEGTPSLAAD